MKHFHFRSLTQILAALFLIHTVGCSHSKVKNETLEPVSITPVDASNNLGSSDQGNAQGLQTVFFDYDSNSLKKSAKKMLDENAKILLSHPSLKIQIEGYCDERGGIQYNLALGSKRADAASHYLMKKGVAKNQLSTISFGKEKPLVPGNTEDAYAKNRRANFAIIAR